MVLTDELQGMCSNLKYLEIEINQFVNTDELNMSEEDGCYCIRLKGKEDETEVEGILLYVKGILNYGFLSVRTETDSVKLKSNFIIDVIR